MTVELPVDKYCAACPHRLTCMAGRLRIRLYCAVCDHLEIYVQLPSDPRGPEYYEEVRIKCNGHNRAGVSLSVCSACRLKGKISDIGRPA